MGDPAEPLDLGLTPAHEYDQPPPRWSLPWSVGPRIALTALGALLVGFLVTTGLSAGRTVAVEQDNRRAELISLIGERQEHVDALAAQLDELRTQLGEVEAQTAHAPRLRAEVERIEAAVGTVAVRGPGLRVTLADASETCPSGREDDCRIQDTDVQLTVNALLGAGGEAVAVNGERLIATSAIRNAGRTVLVNYRVLTSPYVVEAIGNTERLRREFARSEVFQQFGVWGEVYGLGFTTEAVDDLELPPYGGSVRLRSASVEGGDRDP